MVDAMLPMTQPGRCKAFRAIVLTALWAALLAGATGCDTIAQDFVEAFQLNTPSGLNWIAARRSSSSASLLPEAPL